MGGDVEKRTRVAIVGLDTSHPDEFVPLLQAAGCRIVAVCDEHVVYDAAHTERFARRHGIDRVVDTPQEIIGYADVVLVGGCDWTRKRAIAEPLLAAGVGVFLDKPAAASLGELETLRRVAASSGAALTGGSALLWSAEAAALRARGTVRALDVEVGGHPYDYGVHAAALAIGVLGERVEAVSARWQGRNLEGRVWWESGATATLRVGPDREPGYAMSADGATIRPEISGLYGSLVAGVLPVLRGDRVDDERLAAVFLPETVCLAMKASADLEGTRLALRDDAVRTVYWDATDFTRDYAAARRAQ